MRWALLLCLLPLASPRVPVTPLRRRTLLRVLRCLTLDAPDFQGDELSIDIGGTLTKVVLFQPSAPPTDGQRPRLHLGSPRLDAELDRVLKESGERELSIYVPQLGGNLHFFVFESRHIQEAAAFLARRPVWQARRPVWQPKRPVIMRATGAGAFRHKAALERIGVTLDCSLDTDCMMTGLTFLLHNIAQQDQLVALLMPPPDQLSPLATPAAYRAVARNFVTVAHPPNEYIYASVSTETLVLEVKRGPDGEPRHRRLGASCVGGATFWGLVRLLTACETFDEVIRLTEMEGASSARIDMQVGDIYGPQSAKDKLGMKAEVIAASFGKVKASSCPALQAACVACGRHIAMPGFAFSFRSLAACLFEVIAASFGKVVMERDGRLGPQFWLRYLRALLRHYEEGFWLVALVVLTSIPGLRQLAKMLGAVSFAERRAASVAMCGNYRAHDVALSLLRMVSNNIGQVATLYAQQAEMQHIIFGGSFIREHPYTIATISAAVRFFSHGQIQPLFLKHDCFVGAIGAHLQGRPAATHMATQSASPADASPSAPAVQTA